MLPPRSDDPTLTAGVRDASTGSSWVLLLDELAVSRALVLGHVPPDVIDHLERTADHVERGPASVPPPGSVDLLVATPSALRRWTRRRTRQALQAALTPDAVVALVGRHLRARWRRRLAGLLDSTALASTPGVVMRRRGPVPSTPATGLLTVPSLRPSNAVPRTLRRLSTIRRLLAARARRLRATAAPPPITRRHASDLRPLHPTAGRLTIAHTTIAPVRSSTAPAAPPAWLHDVLNAVGVEPSRATWAFVPPRGYRSQKVLFRVADPEAGRHLVVKATQDPCFNARLDAEADALQDVEARQLVPAGSIPRVLRTTTHGGLRVVVEDDCPGRPYRQVSTGGLDCPLITSATAWVTTLAVESASAPDQANGERRGACDALVDDYLAMFVPSTRKAAVLREHADRVATASVPLVYYHGDLGLWNLLARPDGSIVVLDWENAQPAGPPGWDLWTLLQSHSLFVLETRGQRPTPANLGRLWARDDSARRTVTEAVSRYGEVLGIAPPVLVSAAVLGWAHQALRDAARTPQAPGRSWSHRWLDLLLADDGRLIERALLG